MTFLLAVISIAGCSNRVSRPNDLPELHPCTFTITQDGDPLDGAYVSLIPMEETNAKYQTSSVTNHEGKAAFATYGFNGVPAGKYKVCVRKVVGEEDGEYQAVEPLYSDAEYTPHEIEITGKKMSAVSFDVR
ncbi:MAG: carboxypeptidase-like regulatory domain-containing protein [Planctomycetaceae bacterium]|nr:carboxypeptidase-like regulatory domain-containing protein [Planctomycetaceae bacterium]